MHRSRLAPRRRRGGPAPRPHRSREHQPEPNRDRDRIEGLEGEAEGVDAVGAWRDTDNGFEVDTSVELPLDGTIRTIDGAAELGAALAQSDEARSCYALHTVRTATAMDWDRSDPRITPLLDSFQTNDHIPTLFEDIAVSDVFRTFDVTEVAP